VQFSARQAFLFRQWTISASRTKHSFAPDVVCDPLRRLSGAAPDATTNKAGRTRRGT